MKEREETTDARGPSREDDKLWPKKNIIGKQELEIKLGDYHISFEVCSFPLFPRHSPAPFIIVGIVRQRQNQQLTIEDLIDGENWVLGRCTEF